MAAIAAEPAPIAVTIPLALTVATEVFVLDHVTNRPYRMTWEASLTVALICVVWPTVAVTGEGATVTEAAARLLALKAEEGSRGDSEASRCEQAENPGRTMAIVHAWAILLVSLKRYGI